MQPDAVHQQLLAFFTQGEDAMVLGVVRQVRENPYSVTARLSSAKLGRTVQAESLLEYDFLNILDFDPRVRKYGEQCLVIPWKNKDGRKRSYHPDVLVQFDEEWISRDPRLRASVYEVKPSAVLREQWPEQKPKYRAALCALRGTGVRFRLITEQQIDPVFAANVRFLMNYKKPRMLEQRSPQEQAMDAALLKLVWEIKEPITPQEILDRLANTFELRAELLARIWFFVALCTMEADLIEPLTMATPLWPSRYHHFSDRFFPEPKWRQPHHDWYR